MSADASNFPSMELQLISYNGPGFDALANSRLHTLFCVQRQLDLFDLAMKHGNKWLKQWKYGKNQLHIPVDLNFKFMKILHF